MSSFLDSGTIKFDHPVRIITQAAVCGPKEAEGPLAGKFDYEAEECSMGEDSWELAESALQKRAFSIAANKAGLSPSELSFVFAGDLLNQCIGSTYGLRDFGVPFIGLYGACSTFAEALALSAVFADNGVGKQIAAVTSSHFCSAERQFRMPVNYGGQRTPTSQWTATAAGCAIVGQSELNGGKITAATFGKITDMGIKDPNNMGAAMAAAAYETITSHLKQTKQKADDFDLILTGDLGLVGSNMLREMFARDGETPQHDDCGLILYDNKAQDTHAGGSGAGCSSSVMCAEILPKVAAGKLKHILFVATGALLSTTIVQQGESIPGIAHAVEITGEFEAKKKG
jgi:stage V sporulation protein AD